MKPVVLERRDRVSPLFLYKSLTCMQKKLYGMVEGFFSAPRKAWSSLERLTVLEFMLNNCPSLNTYFYCPKDDPFVVKRWDKLYSERALGAIEKAYKRCSANNVEFVYGLNPAFDVSTIEKNFPAYIKQICEKLGQLQALGIASFAILYDDIPYAYNVTGGERSEQDALVGALQAKTMNAIRKYLGRGSTLLFCPSDYFLKKETTYTKVLFRDLEEGVRVLWTGPKIFTPVITKEMLERAQKIAGDHKLVWWDNYPVNDCEHIAGTYHLGGFNAPEKRVQQRLGGLLMNPMREPYANWIALDTFEQSLAVSTYKRTLATEKAYKTLFGKEWKAFYSICLAFGNRSCVDTEPDGCIVDILKSTSIRSLEKTITKLKTDLKKTRSARITNATAQLFLREIASVFVRAENYLALCENVLVGKPWTRDFEMLNRFPITLGKFDFRNQIIKVLESRSAQTRRIGDIPRYSSLTKLRALVNKYRGKSSLAITEPDKRKFVRLVNESIKKDNELFVKNLTRFNRLAQTKEATRRVMINQYQ